jgi:hypothetical protein
MFAIDSLALWRIAKLLNAPTHALQAQFTDNLQEIFEQWLFLSSGKMVFPRYPFLEGMILQQDHMHPLCLG